MATIHHDKMAYGKLAPTQEEIDQSKILEMLASLKDDEDEKEQHKAEKDEVDKRKVDQSEVDSSDETSQKEKKK